MAGIYLTWLVDVLRGAGCTVFENSMTAGWQNRARSSGGFPATPLGVQWHHTASNTTPYNDLSWMIDGSDDAPIGNLLLDRSGYFWPIAAGAANTAGKGGPLTMSRGTIPIDSANTRSVAIEAANNGVGEAWPAVMMDAYFKGSNAINARLGNIPTDVFNHNTWAPSRKIDPATASAVHGSWRPKSTTSSGTWSQVDVCNECAKRAGAGPSPGPGPGPTPPTPTPDEDDDDMDFDGFWRRDNSDCVYAIYKHGAKQWMTDPGYLDAMSSLWAMRGAPPEALSVRVQKDPAMFAAFGLVEGPREPNTDEWGNRV